MRKVRKSEKAAVKGNTSRSTKIKMQVSFDSIILVLGVIPGDNQNDLSRRIIAEVLFRITKHSRQLKYLSEDYRRNSAIVQ
jgi:hypothetical protein